MAWQLCCALNLPYLVLAATAFALSSGPSRSSHGPVQAATFRVQPEIPVPGPDPEWALPPNSNSTHHLIFNSVAGLLHRWPNALRRNGAILYICTDLTDLTRKDGPYTILYVTVSFLQQSPLEQSCTTDVMTLKYQVHLIGLRSTLNIPITLSRILLRDLASSKARPSSRILRWIECREDEGRPPGFSGCYCVGTTSTGQVLLRMGAH